MTINRICFVVAAALCFAASAAYDCRIDGICYNVRPDWGYAAVVADEENPGRDYGNLIIPDYISYGGSHYSVDVIGEKAFYGCKLQSIKLPNTLTHINASAFENSNLKSITLPQSLTSIGEFAFKRTGLTEIFIPKSVETVSYAFLADCPLEKIVVEAGSCFDSRDNCNAVIYNWDSDVLLVAGCKNTIIPESVTNIANGAFKGCEGLTSIVIPDGVVQISSDAFNWCTNLRSVKLPNTLKRIDEAAFFGCKSLTSIDLPHSLTWIENQAFCYSGLTQLVLPNSVTFLGDGAFGGCPMERIAVEEGGCFDSRDDCNAIIYYDSGMESIELCEGCKTTVIPQSVTHITNFAFKGCKGLETIEIPDGVEYIGRYAFYDCTDLKRIVIPASVEEIDDNAFEGCSSLTEVVIKGHPEMGDDVFKDCPNLRNKPSGKITFRDRTNY